MDVTVRGEQSWGSLTSEAIPAQSYKIYEYSGGVIWPSGNVFVNDIHVALNELLNWYILCPYKSTKLYKSTKHYSKSTWNNMLSDIDWKTVNFSYHN